jgi:hypothetical protein
MESDDQTNLPAADEMSGGVRPRPSWYLRWGKATAMWMCGFAVGAAAVFGLVWGKAEYDSYRALQAIRLPEPAQNNELVKMFVPEEKPAVLSTAAAPVPEFTEAKPVRPKVFKSKPVRKQLAGKVRPRKVVMAKTQRRLADNRAMPRILEIRKVNRRPCQRGDLARECYAVR